jgi:hypothetical protein
MIFLFLTPYSFNLVLFPSKRDGLHLRYREGQEDQTRRVRAGRQHGVLWNTIYINAAPNQLRAEDHVILDEDVARLSPLGFRHIDMPGVMPSPFQA